MHRGIASRTGLRWMQAPFVGAEVPGKGPSYLVCILLGSKKASEQRYPPLQPLFLTRFEHKQAPAYSPLALTHLKVTRLRLQCSRSTLLGSGRSAVPAHQSWGAGWEVVETKSSLPCVHHHHHGKPCAWLGGEHWCHLAQQDPAEPSAP